MIWTWIKEFVMPLALSFTGISVTVFYIFSDNTYSFVVGWGCGLLTVATSFWLSDYITEKIRENRLNKSAEKEVKDRCQ